MEFLVRYARVVIMETVVEADSEEDITQAMLPRVHGDSGWPDHVVDVQDYEWIWKVTKNE